MNILHLLYILLGSGMGLILDPFFRYQAKNNPRRRIPLAQRLGYDPYPAGPNVRRRLNIWIHAVSVGEVKAAETIIQTLDATTTKASILLTTTTSTGQRYARKQLGHRANVRYAPLDIWASVGRFLTTHQPDILVCMETEIWPNWITRAYRRGIRTVILNGRISARSIRSYMKIRPLIKPVLEKVDAFSMISEVDAKRIIRLGAPAQRIQINGNVKMDANTTVSDGLAIEDLSQCYGVDGQTPVFIAGSVRGAEAEVMMRVYHRLAARVPGLLFIIAPRHIERSTRIARLAQAEGIAWQYRTTLGKGASDRHAPMVILDTIGELRHVYALASVVFCGASLVPLGGQNVLEAAVWGKPVLFGPSMEDFQEAKNLLETFGGGICVPDSQDLVDRALYLLTHPGEARRMGRLAKKAVLSNQGAAHRHCRVLIERLSKRSGHRD